MLNLERTSLSKYTSIPDSDNQYTVEFIEKSGAIVLESSAEQITVGISEKTSDEYITTIKNYHIKPVTFVHIYYSDLLAWLSKKLGDDDEHKDYAYTNLNDKNYLDRIANDAPTVNLVNSVIMDAIRQGASDIHIESGITCMKIRYRLDGLLHTVRTVDSERFAAVSSRIKIMSNLNILEKRQPQDGRITVSYGKENVDLRVSIIPVTNGESIVMRILGRTTSLQMLDELGFSKQTLSDIRSMMKIHHGLILVTGPTGSGKTTTLNAVMRELVSDEIKIISIEDPVEFLVEGVNQIQINEQIHLGFDSILRRVLRQDPNVIMIGEIRDKPTAELAVRAALTGHLVLSTLHTNDSVSVISRLINMGIEPYLIASVLKGAVAQRLVRKLKQGTSTFDGRTVIAESFLMDEKMEELVCGGAKQSEIYDYLKKSGMIVLAEDAKKKVLAGITTMEEASREVIL